VAKCAACSAAALENIERAIAQSETRHGGQIRFAVEHALDTVSLVRGLSRARACPSGVLALKVWDTEHNTGVLIYLYCWPIAKSNHR